MSREQHGRTVPERAHWPRTLSFYIVREVVAYTLIGLAAISIVILTRNLVQQLDKLAGVGFRLEDVITIVKILATLLTVYALPVSLLFGVLLAIGRLAADVEIIAMRACGIGMRGLLLPILAIGVALSALTLVLTLHVEPAAYREMSLSVRRLLVRGASIEPKRFNQIGGRTLYVDERGEDGWLRGVMISDRSDPERAFVVFAEAGRLHLDEATETLVLRLERGDVHIEPHRLDDDRYRRARFGSLEYRFDVTGALGPEAMQRPRALPLEELRATVARIEAGIETGPLREEPEVYLANLQRRYALPVAPLLFALIGVPLGMRRRRGARSYGVIICAVLAFGYFAIESFCELLVIEMGYPARTLMWIPNLVFATLGVALVVRARRIL